MGESHSDWNNSRPKKKGNELELFNNAEGRRRGKVKERMVVV